MSNLPEAADDLFTMATLNEEGQPSESGPRLNGSKLAAIIVMSCLLLAVAITVLLIRISHRQEQAATEKRQKEAKEKESKLTDYIICRYYTREEEAERRRRHRQPKGLLLDESQTEATYYSRSNSASSSGSGNARTEYLRTIGYSLPQNQLAVNENETPLGEEFSCLECALCSEEFTSGDVICKSNNPKCEHEFHEQCMTTWLNIQNICPICNQPYVLQSV